MARSTNLGAIDILRVQKATKWMRSPMWDVEEHKKSSKDDRHLGDANTQGGERRGRISIHSEGGQRPPFFQGILEAISGVGGPTLTHATEGNSVLANGCGNTEVTSDLEEDRCRQVMRAEA